MGQEPCGCAAGGLVWPRPRVLAWGGSKPSLRPPAPRVPPRRLHAAGATQGCVRSPAHPGAAPESPVCRCQGAGTRPVASPGAHGDTTPVRTPRSRGHRCVHSDTVCTSRCSGRPARARSAAFLRARAPAALRGRAGGRGGDVPVLRDRSCSQYRNHHASPNRPGRARGSPRSPRVLQRSKKTPAAPAPW